MLTSPVICHENIKQTKNKILNIGWVGDFGNGNEISKEFSHKKSMYEILFPVLKSINKPLNLTLIGVKNQKDIPEIHKYFQDAEQININILKDLDWKNDKDWVYEEIAKFDIGISPMTNHLYNRSKSAFKSKQYLSVGVPAIASDVGENSKYVLNEINGIIFTSSEELKKAIERFIEMQDDEYAFFSKNALKHKSNYSLKKYFETIVAHY
jgi:glycosyltransferase involved in cell wall biosynthesis